YPRDDWLETPLSTTAPPDPPPPPPPWPASMYTKPEGGAAPAEPPLPPSPPTASTLPPCMRTSSPKLIQTPPPPAPPPPPPPPRPPPTPPTAPAPPTPPLTPVPPAAPAAASTRMSPAIQPDPSTSIVRVGSREATFRVPPASIMSDENRPDCETVAVEPAGTVSSSWPITGNGNSALPTGVTTRSTCPETCPSARSVSGDTCTVTPNRVPVRP